MPFGFGYDWGSFKEIIIMTWDTFIFELKSSHEVVLYLKVITGFGTSHINKHTFLQYTIYGYKLPLCIG